MILRGFNLCVSELVNLVFHEPCLVEGDAYIQHDVILCNLIGDTGSASHPFNAQIYYGLGSCCVLVGKWDG